MAQDQRSMINSIICILYLKDGEHSLADAKFMPQSLYFFLVGFLKASFELSLSECDVTL